VGRPEGKKVRRLEGEREEPTAYLYRFRLKADLGNRIPILTWWNAVILVLEFSALLLTTRLPTPLLSGSPE